jgi:hypothetical protein
MRRALVFLIGLAALAGCEVYEPATPDEIARSAYVSDEPHSVTLVSMVNNRSGRSAHAALVINGSQRVLYDPAGTFQHPELPRADDIHYGITPRHLDYYERYHARFSHHVHSQKVPVSRETADLVLARAREEGKTLKMHCSLAIADVLKPVPPFQHVRSSYFPETLRGDFARIAGVEDNYVYEVDVGKNRSWERVSGEDGFGAGPPT